MIRSLILAAVLAGCAAAAPAAQSPRTFTPGSSGQADLAAGSYRVSWTAQGCTYLDLRWAPAAGAEVIIVRAGPDGSPISPAGTANVALPAGPGFLNRSADCDYVVTLGPLGG